MQTHSSENFKIETKNLQLSSSQKTMLGEILPYTYAHTPGPGIGKYFWASSKNHLGTQNLY